MEATEPKTSRKALISGAGFAGLTAAFWMRRLGYQVTVVETAAAVKKGGTPVDIRDDTIAIVERMGILEAIRAKSLPPRLTEFRDIDGGTDARIEPDPVGAHEPVDGYEIPRDDLLAILFAQIEGEVEMVFENSISAITEYPERVQVEFRDGSTGDFDIVLGCDGNHSTVRRLHFGPEAEYSHFLRNYFTVSIVDETLIDENTTQIISTPGRTLMLNAYENKTDIVLSFHSEQEIAYDYRDVAEQKSIIGTRFADAGETFTEMVKKADAADNFYFDKLSQTKMPRWTTGRVALVGDAGYCASPAAGMGGSLAIIGATALFDALQSTGGDIEAGFAEYERRLRPVVDEIQAAAVGFGLANFFPETQEAIDSRNASFSRI